MKVVLRAQSVLPVREGVLDHILRAKLLSGRLEFWRALFYLLTRPNYYLRRTIIWVQSQVKDSSNVAWEIIAYVIHKGHQTAGAICQYFSAA